VKAARAVSNEHFWKPRKTKNEFEVG